MSVTFCLTKECILMDTTPKNYYLKLLKQNVYCKNKPKQTDKEKSLLTLYTFPLGGLYRKPEQ